MLLVIGSFGQNWTNTLLPNGATGQWYAELWHDAAFRRAFSTSLMVALAACAINAVLATPLAYALHRGERAGRAFAGRVVAAMPVAVPPITLGFGYLIVFNTDAMPWLGSTPLLIAAHAIATLPYLTNALLTDLRHLGLDRLEQAAATLGATEYQRFTGIVLPSLRQSCCPAWSWSRPCPSVNSIFQPVGGFQSHLSGAAVAGVLWRHGIRLRRHRGAAYPRQRRRLAVVLSLRGSQ